MYGGSMAKKKAPAYSGAVPTAEELARQEEAARRQAANERADRKRRENAEKQARFRKSMKEKGYREVKQWEKPPAPGQVKPWGKLPPPLIKESSAGVCERDAAISAAVQAMMSAYFHTMRGDGENMAPEAWDVYRDIEALLAPLGYKRQY
jgi:hypothetical protein